MTHKIYRSNVEFSFEDGRSSIYFYSDDFFGLGVTREEFISEDLSDYDLSAAERNGIADVLEMLEWII